MNGKVIGLIAAAAVAIVVLLVLSRKSFSDLQANLPPKVLCASDGEAGMKALLWQMENPGGRIVPVLGTGSMAPFIPAAPQGRNPMETVVAMLGVVRVPFDSIREGDLLTYTADFSQGHPVCHVAAKKEGRGWIMSGLNNRYSETWTRVTEETYIAKVVVVWVWPI